MTLSLPHDGQPASWMHLARSSSGLPPCAFRSTFIRTMSVWRCSISPLHLLSLKLATATLFPDGGHGRAQIVLPVWSKRLRSVSPVLRLVRYTTVQGVRRFSTGFLVET